MKGPSAAAWSCSGDNSAQLVIGKQGSGEPLTLPFPAQEMQTENLLQDGAWLIPSPSPSASGRPGLWGCELPSKASHPVPPPRPLWLPLSH